MDLFFNTGRYPFIPTTVQNAVSCLLIFPVPTLAVSLAAEVTIRILVSLMPSSRRLDCFAKSLEVVLRCWSF